MKGDSIFLLDANALIALGDSNHVHHERVQKWFQSHPGRAWATCPLTENAFMRIIGTPSYPGYIGDPLVLRDHLAAMRMFSGHQFWADTLSLCDSEKFPSLPGAKQQTDIYLLALAISRKGKLATLDRRIDPSILPDGSKACFLIP